MLKLELSCWKSVLERKIILVTESLPPETLEQLEARGYHFPLLPAPFNREELHAVVFGQSCAGATSPFHLLLVVAVSDARPRPTSCTAQRTANDLVAASRSGWVLTEADRSSTCILLPEEY